ncbi:MAG TPA: hypothetical protein PKI46_00790 [Bacteroidales bacterium]|nr:hypothetical protein [Bacteroidales bacterium]
MIEIGYKFKSNFDINVTVIEKYNNYGSYIVSIRKLDKKGRIINEGVKLVTEDDIKSKNINFEEDYLTGYAQLLREESQRKKRFKK